MPKTRRLARKRSRPASEERLLRKITPRGKPSTFKDECVISVAKTHAPTELLSMRADQSKDDIPVRKGTLKKKVKQRIKREKWIKRLAEQASKLPINKDLKNKNKMRSCMEFANLQEILDNISEEGTSDQVILEKKKCRQQHNSNNIALQLEKVKAVINHPDYARNPLDAIKRHLSNTL